MTFSELSPKIHKISPSAVKMTYDSKHTVWIETDLIDCDIKLAENGRVDRNERPRMEVFVSALILLSVVFYSTKILFTLE
jgi:hypothetical protein